MPTNGFIALVNVISIVFVVAHNHEYTVVAFATFFKELEILATIGAKTWIFTIKMPCAENVSS
jgi:hypothetical protein